MGKRLNLIAEKFNRLTVISYAGIVGKPTPEIAFNM